MLYIISYEHETKIFGIQYIQGISKPTYSRIYRICTTINFPLQLGQIFNPVILYYYDERSITDQYIHSSNSDHTNPHYQNFFKPQNLILFQLKSEKLRWQHFSMCYQKRLVLFHMNVKKSHWRIHQGNYKHTLLTLIYHLNKDSYLLSFTH